MTRSVLITGASSGIGHATAARLARRGMRVYATARDPQTITDLADEGCEVLALDVTNEASMAEAVAAVENAHGQVDVLVNNAGYGQYGAIEEVAIEDVRLQLETNLVGPVRLIQLVLPGMRAAGGGTIVNVSSMGGGFTLPGGGCYHASKHALEAISDALRFEVGPFGVKVAIIQPGLIKTNFDVDAVVTAAEATDQTGPYANFGASVQAVLASSYGSWLSATPNTVARTIERAVTARAPRTRYRVTFAARVLLTLRWLLPDRIWDAAVSSRFRPAGNVERDEHDA